MKTLTINLESIFPIGDRRRYTNEKDKCQTAWCTVVGHKDHRLVITVDADYEIDGEKRLYVIDPDDTDQLLAEHIADEYHWYRVEWGVPTAEQVWAIQDELFGENDEDTDGES